MFVAANQLIQFDATARTVRAEEGEATAQCFV